MADEDIKRLVLTEYAGTCHWHGTEFDKLPGFKCRADDVWVCSFPRSGTTLTQQIVYLIVTLDFEKAVTVNIDDRFPHAEPMSEDFETLRGLSYLDEKPEEEPRMIKSHLHYFLLPDELKKGKGRIVYITRNPKSSVPSLFRVLNYIKNPPADSLTEYIELFFKGKVVWPSIAEWQNIISNWTKLPSSVTAIEGNLVCLTKTILFRAPAWWITTVVQVLAGPWGLHVKEYWQHCNDSNILFIQFEKLIKDRKGAIRQIAEFLGRDLTDQQVDKIFDYTTIDSMKNNDSVNFFHYESLYPTDNSESSFINKGEVSGWKKDVSAELSKRFDEYIHREIGETDITF